MLEIILSYIIIIAPSLVTIFGAIATIVASVNKMRKNSAEAKIVVEQANTLMKEVRESPLLQEILAQQARENSELRKSLTLLSEELRHINNLHPEWKDEQGGDK